MTFAVRTISGGQLAPQLHVGAARLAPHVRPVTMQTNGTGFRARCMPAPGTGFWTADLTLHAGEPTSPFADVVRRGGALRRAAAFWRLTPDPDARLVLIDSVKSGRALLAAYPFGDGELDFEAVARTGVDGLHVTYWAAAASGSPFATWETAATLWFTWRFIGSPEPLPVPQWAQAPAQRAPLGIEPTRLRLTGQYDGFWVQIRPPSPDEWRALRMALATRDTPTISAAQTDAAAQLVENIVLSVVTGHNIGDARGRPLPASGPELARRLPASLRQAILQAWVAAPHPSMAAVTR